MATPVWLTGTALETAIDGGANDTIDIAALVTGEITIVAISGIRDWMAYDPTTFILTLTNAPIVEADTTFAIRFRAADGAGLTADARVLINVSESRLFSLHNSLFFRECVNYEAGRVVIRGTSTVVSEMIDNDYGTFSTETDIDVDMSDGADATAFQWVFVKYKGDLTTVVGTPTGGVGSAFTHSVPTTTETWQGTSQSLTVNGWKHDLFAVPVTTTATSVRMQFTGTGIEIYALALLDLAFEINANTRYVAIDPNLVDRTGRVFDGTRGNQRRGTSLGAERWKWEIGYECTFTEESVFEFVFTHGKSAEFLFLQRVLEFSPVRLSCTVPGIERGGGGY